jgi:hypothetical protein
MHRRKRRSTRAWVLATGVASLVVEGASTWARSGRLAGELVVRCRQGHVFTTLWFPAASLKSLRLGPWRYQYCPVGRHWGIVRPVREADLTRAERQMANRHHDLRIP